MFIVGANLNEVEHILVEKIGCKYSMDLSSRIAILHLAVKSLGKRLYDTTVTGKGTLVGSKVFCSDMTVVENTKNLLRKSSVQLYVYVKIKSCILNLVQML